MKGHFAYISGYLICGGCGSSLCPYNPQTPIDNEYTYRVYCTNPSCACYLEVYEPTDKIKVGLIPTKLRAPDPNAVAQQQQQAQVRLAGEIANQRTGIGATGHDDRIVAVNVPGTFQVTDPREWTQLTNIEAPPLPRNIAEREAQVIRNAQLVTETPRLLTREEVEQRYPTNPNQAETPGGLIRR